MDINWLIDEDREDERAGADEDFSDDREIGGESAPSGICSECGEECTGVAVDEGIGAYEFWGAKGVQHDWRWASPCCEAEVVYGGNKCYGRKIVTAKKEYKTKKGVIQVGEKYERETWRYWRKDGPSWFVIKHRKTIPTTQNSVSIKS
jgi:hypothetical protein